MICVHFEIFSWLSRFFSSLRCLPEEAIPAIAYPNNGRPVPPQNHPSLPPQQLDQCYKFNHLANPHAPNSTPPHTQTQSPMNGLYSCTGINNSINGIQQGYDNRLMNPYVYIHRVCVCVCVCKSHCPATIVKAP